MILIVGLGNPGEKYKNTRHNIGFQVIENFQKENNFPKFRSSKKLMAETSEGFLNEEEIILAKPQTFMNNSGKAVKKLFSNFQFLISNLWVIHDDIDLTLGKIRIVKNRGAGGHKGVESIIENLKSKNFIRLRVGIRPKTDKPKNLEKFVLQKFNIGEEKTAKEVIKKTAEAVDFFLKEGLEKTMNKFNR